MSLFSSIPLVHIHFLSYKPLIYMGFNLGKFTAIILENNVRENIG